MWLTIAADPGGVWMLLLLAFAAGCGRIGFSAGDVGSVDDAAGKLSVGRDHACAVVGEAVWCWGRNQGRQLGDGTTQTRAQPVRALPSIGVTAVAAGYAHTCAISVIRPATATVPASGGEVWCWGNNEQLQLGQDIVTGVTPTNGGEDPVVVPGLPANAVEIAAGWDHTCARFGDGTVWCWGRNHLGQLGRGTTDAEGQRAMQVLGVAEVAQIASRGDATCARERSGAVRCWGENSDHQLGDGTDVDQSTPVAVVGVTARWISMGSYHACAITTADQYTCWGYNGYGELGDGTTNDRPVAATSSIGSDYSTVAAGEHFSCAIQLSGAVACWGRNDEGTLGDGTTERRSAPAAVTGLTDIRAISASVHHVCALRGDGAVLCWGDGSFGELGNGEAAATAPIPVVGLSATQVSTGRSHACALTANQIQCWGAGQDGQLGDGGTSSRSSPVTVAATPASPRQLGLGGYHSCVVLNDDTVWCWGYGNYGQIGNGVADTVETPTQVIGLSAVAAIASGNAFTCAVLLDGTVWCWGENSDGQLGDGTLTDASTPVQVAGVAGAVEIAAGRYHACARTAALEVYCWGDNADGQLGLGTTDDSSATLIPGLAAVTIRAGGYHSCATDASNALWCWGSNGSGQVGVWGPDYLVPTSVGVADVQALALGAKATTMITTTGSQSWGGNDRGQLADGTFASHGEPMAALWPSTVTSISMGESFACAATDVGDVSCVGGNHEGQLGQGTTTRALTPVRVAIP